ncbi:dihydrodipicolinate synthase family protein [Schlesneria sp. T3-172]|uniref:dihydrodipicolinate synthase family protein n=1 Tax=Schlesneria TaxID=656899 RepID=UPI002EF38530
MSDKFHGIYPMLLPFYLPDDRVDLEIMRREVELVVACGCHGLGVMGLGTEVNKLSTAERLETLAAVAESLGGRLPLSVTIGENTVRGQIEFGRYAAELGASWLILQPPPVSDVSELELLRFFGAVADAVPLPIAVQNAAIYLGIQLTPAGLVSLHRQHPNVTVLKTEDTPEVTSRLMNETNGVFQLFVGRAGLDMIDQLRAGAVGIIPGMETVDRTSRIYDHFRAGREAEATTVYNEILPTLVYLEKSINHFVTASREILARRWSLDQQPVRHRLARQIDAFGHQMISRCATSMGLLAPPPR